MSLDEFFEKLKATPGDWIIHPSGDIVAADDLSCCPYLAVHPAPELSRDDLRALFAAADNNTHLSHFDPALRARLLEACGLTEPAT